MWVLPADSGSKAAGALAGFLEFNARFLDCKSSEEDFSVLPVLFMACTY